MQSSSQIITTNIQFFTGRMPFLSPNQQCQSTEGENITICVKLKLGSRIYRRAFLCSLVEDGYHREF